MHLSMNPHLHLCDLLKCWQQFHKLYSSGHNEIHSNSQISLVIMGFLILIFELENFSGCY
jgi:hypothetical protein